MSALDAIATLDDVDVAGRKVLVRVDFNVPLHEGAVTDLSRIEAARPTVMELLDRGAGVILLSHMGRPDGVYDATMTLAAVAPAAQRVFGRPVTFIPFGQADEAAARLKPGELILLDNVRFVAEEETDGAAFADRLAGFADLYVNDAFSASHRAHASVSAVARRLPSVAGRSLETELRYLDRALAEPERPVLAIVGGAKVSTKLELLENLIAKVDMLAVGGAMANTFFAARGFDMRASLYESDLIGVAKAIMAAAEREGCRLILPVDVVAASEFKKDARRRVCAPDGLAPGEMILDAGPAAVDALADAMDRSKTLLWNGPLGAFETKPFDTATTEAARYAAKLSKAGELLAVAGGGDTVAALNAAGASADFGHVSTAGGAFLQWLEGRPLPGVVALQENARQFRKGKARAI